MDGVEQSVRSSGRIDLAYIPWPDHALDRTKHEILTSIFFILLDGRDELHFLEALYRIWKRLSRTTK